jgi:hypothetical protein
MSLTPLCCDAPPPGHDRNLDRIAYAVGLGSDQSTIYDEYVIEQAVELEDEVTSLNPIENLAKDSIQRYPKNISYGHRIQDT